MSTTQSNNQPSTTAALFRRSVAQNPDKVALMYRKGKEWETITWKEFAAQVDAIAATLTARGIARGDRVAILSENSPWWIIADLANATLGVTTVGIYPTLPAPQIAYILKDSGTKAIFAQDKKQLDKVAAARADAPDVAHVFALESEHAREGVAGFDTLVAEGRGKPVTPAELGPDDVAVLIYTSGTTGDPKGAMLTHRNLTSNVYGVLEHFASGGVAIGPDDLFLSFLPLAHSFERIIHMLAIGSAASIAYSQGARTLMDEMGTVKPTVMGCVPRVFEAMMDRMIDSAAKADESKRKAFQTALAVGKEVVARRQSGKGVGPILAIQHLIYDKLVGQKIRERFGGRIRLLISGGAALNPETARFFHAMGFKLLEGYGLTETSPVIAVNPASNPRIGTVGTIIPGGEVKIAEDGEILYRGPNVMKGYWKNDAATAEMIDGGGWLHTGDVGRLDDGYLKITDRKKDIIVLANGKNVAPLPIESTMKQSPFIAEICLIGDKQSVITALVLPNRERLRAWAKEQGLTFADDAALIALPETKKKIKAEIDAQSKALADFEKIKRFTVLDAVFSIDGGELTPKMSVKRKVVAQKYAKEIAELRGGEDA